MMKLSKLFFLLPVFLILYACPMVPSSSMYRPMDIESKYFMESTRCILPNDVKNFTNENYDHKLLNWTGIIKKVTIINEADSLKLRIIVDHKYWDFIEDNSIQDEKIFLSEKGEGEFYFTKTYPNSYQKELDSISNTYRINDFIICYGTLHTIVKNTPELHAEFSRVVPYKYYSTKIWRYDAKKDSITGRTICNGKGNYDMDNFEALKIPTSGQNK